MFAFAYGAAFGAIQQMPRIVPGIEEVRALPQPQIQQTASQVQAYQEFGGLAGRFLLAVLALWIVSRRQLIRVFQIPGLIVMPLVFYYGPTHSLEMTKWGMFLAGVFTVGQLSFWGNYLPRVYPTHLRGTGEGFRRQYRRPHAGHGLRLRDDDAHQLCAGRNAADAPRRRRDDCRHLRLRCRPDLQLLPPGAKG